MRTKVYLASAGFALLLSTTAMAGTTNINNLPDQGQVTLNGTVESVQNEREFTLRDSSGNTIGIDLATNQSITLKKGDQVTVSGMVDDKIITKDVNASDVDVEKGFSRGLTDAVKSIPGVSMTDAQAYNISQLPAEGMVKISGVVTDVDNAKEFTLKDNTGTINIDIESDEFAQLTKGARVTVIGKIDSGLLGKDINATQVLVTADAQANSNY